MTVQHVEVPRAVASGELQPRAFPEAMDSEERSTRTALHFFLHKPLLLARSHDSSILLPTSNNIICHSASQVNTLMPYMRKQWQVTPCNPSQCATSVAITPMDVL
jgi:hypothetical protein